MGQKLKPLGKPLSTHLSNGPGDVLVDGVGDLRSLHARLELHGEHARVVPQPPVVGLVASQARAVDAGLLAGPDAYDLQRCTKRDHALLHGEPNHSQGTREDLPQSSCSLLNRGKSAGN